jgi:hypothetical protein
MPIVLNYRTILFFAGCLSISCLATLFFSGTQKQKPAARDLSLAAGIAIVYLPCVKSVKLSTYMDA